MVSGAASMYWTPQQIVRDMAYVVLDGAAGDRLRDP
jgi:hypothetical protein